MPALNIRSLSLRDFRRFDEFHVDFHERLTVLVAPNGSGKTSVLDAIAVALGPYVGAFDEAIGKGFESTDIRLVPVRETRSNEVEHAPDGVWLKATGRIPGGISERLGVDATDDWQRALAGPVKAKTTTRDAKELVEYGKRMQHAVRSGDSEVTLPLIAYYGTGRLWKRRNQTSAKLARTSRTIGYANCLDSASNYHSFVDWFRYWNLNAKTDRIKAQELGMPLDVGNEFDGYIESVSRAVDACLGPSGWQSVGYSFAREALVASHPIDGELPVDLLSDGIRNMIGMVADIAFRATKLNPHLGRDAAERTPGIVLIDEIDMHLHPEWQQVVIKRLVDAFPRLQFIVATHSPQVLSSVKRESIRILGRDSLGRHRGTEPLARTYGATSQAVLQRVMQVNPQPPIAEAQKLRELTQLVDEGRFETERVRTLMAELVLALGDSHDQIQRLRRSIERQKRLGVGESGVEPT